MHEVAMDLQMPLLFQKKKKWISMQERFNIYLIFVDSHPSGMLLDNSRPSDMNPGMIRVHRRNPTTLSDGGNLAPSDDVVGLRPLKGLCSLLSDNVTHQMKD